MFVFHVTKNLLLSNPQLHVRGPTAYPLCVLGIAPINVLHVRGIKRVKLRVIHIGLRGVLFLRLTRLPLGNTFSAEFGTQQNPTICFSHTELGKALIIRAVEYLW